MKNTLVLFVLCLFFFFFLLNVRPLFDPDEGRNAEVAFEMVKNKNYALPTFNGKAHISKPVFFYWMDAFSMKIFGKGECQARLPSAVFSLLLILATYLFIRRISSKELAFYSALILATSLEYIIYARYVIFDATLTFFFSVSLYLFYLYFKEKNKCYLFISYISIGLGCLTKGPVALILPILIFFIFLLFHYNFIKSIKLLYLHLGLPIVFFINLPWYLMVEHAYPGFSSNFLLHENILRFLTPQYHRTGPIVYYIPVFLAGFFPWSIYFCLCIAKKVKLIWKEKDEIQFFSLLWFGIVFVFFSLSHSKLPHYILPLFPAAAIICASYIKSIRLSKSFFSLQTILYILIVVGASIHFYYKLHAENTLLYLFIGLSIPLLAAVYLYGRNLIVGNITSITIIFLVMLFTATNYLSFFSSAKDVAGFLNHTCPHQIISTFYVSPFSLVFYYNGKVVENKKNRYIVTKLSKIPYLKGKIIYKKGKWVVIDEGASHSIQKVR